MTPTALAAKARITACLPASVQSILGDAAAFPGVALNSPVVSAAAGKSGLPAHRNDGTALDRWDANDSLPMPL